MATLNINDPRIIAYLEDLARAGFLDKAVWKTIGEALLRSTKKRYAKQQAPDGTRWAPLSPQYAAWKKRHKKGRKILKLEGEMRNTLNYQAGDASVAIGSDREYSSIHQFGGRFKAFGQHNAVMPARPFLGLSAEDEQAILDTIADAFEANQP
ncbi:MAG: phage virion morphogenesis protein [Cardiobacteriaceae bacterium]|nr:phage virion morphogenesis protein [Cardiobacteriaceae bacterium]